MTYAVYEINASDIVPRSILKWNGPVPVYAHHMVCSSRDNFRYYMHRLAIAVAHKISSSLIYNCVK